VGGDSDSFTDPAVDDDVTASGAPEFNADADIDAESELESAAEASFYSFLIETSTTTRNTDSNTEDSALDSYSDSDSESSDSSPENMSLQPPLSPPSPSSLSSSQPQQEDDENNKAGKQEKGDGNRNSGTNGRGAVATGHNMTHAKPGAVGSWSVILAMGYPWSVRAAANYTGRVILHFRYLVEVEF
jgi:hypothetical protein